MPNPASRFTGTYRILQPGDAGPPVPPEQKGVRYLSSRLQCYGEAQLELTVTDPRTGRWSVTAGGATPRLMLSSEAGNESFVLSGRGRAMSLDGRWQGVSLV